MSNRNKKREDKLRNLKRGQSARIEDIIAVCDEHGIDIAHAKTGSHFLIKHRLIQKFAESNNVPDIVGGCFTLPEKKGKVYQQWVARLIKFIDFKIDYERRDNDQRKKP